MDRPGNNGFGVRLKGLRERDGLTQEQVAAELRSATETTTTGSVSRWERGLGYPHAGQVIALAKLFKVSTDHLLLGQASEPYPLNLPEFTEFLQTEFGRIAQARGYVKLLMEFPYPSPPNATYYAQLVSTMMLQDEEPRPDPARGGRKPR